MRKHDITKLTVQERKVINGFLRGMTEKEALIEAGYSERTAIENPDRIFHRERVEKEINKRLRKMEERNAVTEDWIVSQLKRIAEAELGDIIVVDPESGNVAIDYTKLTPSLRAALSGMDISEYTEGRGLERRPVRNIKIRMHDKLKALDMLARILGMFKDKVEVVGDRDLIAAIQKGRERVNSEVSFGINANDTL